MNYRVFYNHTQAATSLDYSEPFEMGDANTVSVQIVSVAGVIATGSIKLSLSDDLENWVIDSTSVSLPTAAPGVSLSPVSSVVARFARLRVLNPGADVCFHAFVNTAKI